MISGDEEHDRQDIHNNLEHKIAARILKHNLAGKIMLPKRQIIVRYARPFSILGLVQFFPGN
jgi:hypothetical protein